MDSLILLADTKELSPQKLLFVFVVVREGSPVQLVLPFVFLVNLKCPLACMAIDSCWTNSIANQHRSLLLIFFHSHSGGNYYKDFIIDICSLVDKNMKP